MCLWEYEMWEPLWVREDLQGLEMGREWTGCCSGTQQGRTTAVESKPFQKKGVGVGSGVWGWGMGVGGLGGWPVRHSCCAGVGNC